MDSFMMQQHQIVMLDGKTYMLNTVTTIQELKPPPPPPDVPVVEVLRGD